MDSVPRWFKGVRLNFAENILFVGDASGRPTTSPGKEDSEVACTAVREACYVEPIQHVTWGELRQRVGRLSSAMRRRGVRKGDRIAVVSSVSIDTLLVFLAATSIGAIFSSSSTDMGIKGILDRLLQIKPKFIFADDAAIYKKKTIDLRPKISAIVDALRDVPEFRGVVTQRRFDTHLDISEIPRCETWGAFMEASVSDELEFAQLDFSDPMVSLLWAQCRYGVESLDFFFCEWHRASPFPLPSGTFVRHLALQTCPTAIISPLYSRS